MAANYPVSKDDGTSLPNPTGTSTQNNPDHAGLHATENAAIIALESKVGIGATTPVANTLLFGTSTGTSVWQQLTSANLAASISDETGSGSLVFANTPTLITPKVDTISESTPSNGVTVGGVNLKAGVVNGSGAGLSSATVPGASLVNSSVIPDKLATGGVSNTVATSETTASTTYVGLTTAQAVTATIGVNGLALVCISANMANNTTEVSVYTSFAMSGTNTLAASDSNAVIHRQTTATSVDRLGVTKLFTGLTPGSTTFTLQFRVVNNTGTYADRNISVIPL